MEEVAANSRLSRMETIFDGCQRKEEVTQALSEEARRHHQELLSREKRVMKEQSLKKGVLSTEG